MKKRTDKLAVLHSSKTHNWETPPDFFELLNEMFDFKVDMAATKENTLCEKYWTEKTDAFKQDWGTPGYKWCNPPFGRTIGNWTRKAAETNYRRNSGVVMLLPARTDVRWWWDVKDRCETWLLRGRLHFRDPAQPLVTTAAPFPTMLLIFGSEAQPGVIDTWDWKEGGTKW